jgi:hypothetical protein
VVSGDNHWADAAIVPEVDVRPRERESKQSVAGGSTQGCANIPANASAANFDGHLAWFQPLRRLDLVDGWFRIGHPQVVICVCEDADVGLVDDSRSGAHGGRVESCSMRGRRREGGREGGREDAVEGDTGIYSSSPTREYSIYTARSLVCLS